jgi:E-phenylitaconyl-CoA hydratase
MSIQTSLDDRVLTVTINRPQQMNSLDPETRASLIDTINGFRQNDDAWVAILTGAGDRAFCAGADLKKTLPPAGPFAATHFSAAGGDELWRPFNAVTKPIIAAINGAAYGGGLELALACDIRIASSSAVFSQSEVRVGSMPGAGGTVRLLQAVPRAVAMKMLLTGQKMSAEEAYRVGLVSDLVAPEDLMNAAREMAKQICRNAPLSVRATKFAAMLGENMAPGQGLEVERLLWGVLRNTDDRIEGRRAFAEKRDPKWRGS